MKILFFILFMFSAFAVAQESDTVSVSEDVYNCVNEVYDSPEGIKLLVQRLLSDREYLRQVHRELLKDPETKKMMQEFMQKNKEMMNEGMNREEDDIKNENDFEKRKVMEGKADLLM